MIIDPHDLPRLDCRLGRTVGGMIIEVATGTGRHQRDMIDVKEDGLGLLM